MEMQDMFTRANRNLGNVYGRLPRNKLEENNQKSGARVIHKLSSWLWSWLALSFFKKRNIVKDVNKDRSMIILIAPWNYNFDCVFPFFYPFMSIKVPMRFFNDEIISIKKWHRTKTYWHMFAFDKTRVHPLAYYDRAIYIQRAMRVVDMSDLFTPISLITNWVMTLIIIL